MKRFICLVPIIILFAISSLLAQSIPADKAIHLTKGMSEAEVLSRFGPPTTVSYGSTETKGRIGDSGRVKLRSTETKIYNYIGDPGEWNTIIYIQDGKVVDYKRTR
jgi:hypothetical protein